MRHPSFVFVTLLTLFVVTWCNLSQSQDPGTGSGINVTTWQNDVGRTGQNLAEGTITYNNIATSNFGQLCSAALDGQVFAQPLVVQNVTINNIKHASVAYVVTENDTLYAIDGASCKKGY